MSTTDAAPSAPSLKEVALGDLEAELATTRRVLERVPEEHLGWKPHEKSMTLGALATHLANLPFWGTTTLRSEELDIAATPLPPLSPATSRAELLGFQEQRAAELREALAEASDARLGETWAFRRGEHIILRMPRVAVLRTMMISHMAHHRGQLSVYLRLLDVPVPSVYGPTADEPGPV